jgi:hypothetical protein
LLRGRLALLKWRAGSITPRLNMYIAQASNGIFEIVKNLGVIEPNESFVSARYAVSP